MSDIYTSYIHLYTIYSLYIPNIHYHTNYHTNIRIQTYFTYSLQATRCVFSHRRTYSSRTNPTPTSPISHHIQLHSRKGLVTCICKCKLVALIIHELYQLIILILLTTHHERIYTSSIQIEISFRIFEDKYKKQCLF